MKTLTNDYPRAVEIAGGLFAVELSAGGWTVADGLGIVHCEPDATELAGWHVPVRFESEQAAITAIHTGPSAWFDIAADSVWVKHCLQAGGTAITA
ncbi:hypothetical protein [Paraburkholderia sp. GAS32]|uniref:hypothetical protein n=1 Tax=Paraburkholderia sp. GAS32 TaxID=3035129 RepID=UPI003D1FD869